MSQNSEQFEKTNDDDSQNNSSDNQGSNNNQKKGKGFIDYTLQKMKDAAVFVVHYQAPQVTEYLKNFGAYQATNGITIVLGALYPEWKYSLNTIRLDGTNGKGYGRPDITTFAKPIQFLNKDNTQYRDNAVALFNNAMAEFVTFLKDYYGTAIPETQKSEDGHIVLR